jgi:hypothetical protein
MIRTRLSQTGIILLAFLVCSVAQSDQIQKERRSFLEQRGCPIKAIASGGSALVVKNVSDKQIASFVLGCLTRSGKTYEVVDTYDSSDGSIEPGGVAHEGGMDATPLNICRSLKGVLSVGSVKFADGSSWQSPLMKNIAKSRREVKK